MFKNIPFVMSILVLILTACAAQPQGTPTLSAVDVQNTAISVASTMVAETQMAIPTATLVPPPTDMPTPIPLPTFTPELSMPTLPPLLIQPSPTTAFSSTSSLGECNRMLNVAEAGPTVPVRIQNQSGGEVLLSLYLSKNTYAQCGYMPGVPLIRGSYTIFLPTGYWSFYALIDYGKGKSGKDYGGFIVQPSGGETVKIIKR